MPCFKNTKLIHMVKWECIQKEVAVMPCTSLVCVLDPQTFGM